MVDELSSDETPQRLQNYTIWHMTPPERLGVTYNWNMVKLPPLRRTVLQCRPSCAALCSCAQCFAPDLHKCLLLSWWVGPGVQSLTKQLCAHMHLPCTSQAYRAWLDTDHEFLFYVNNDVLVPDGVVDALARAMTPEGERCVVCSSRTQLLPWLAGKRVTNHVVRSSGTSQRDRRACMGSMLSRDSHCTQFRSPSGVRQAGTATWSRPSPPSRARGTGARWRAWSCSSTCRTRATTSSAARSTTAACR